MPQEPYALLAEEVNSFQVGTRQPSAALLSWFLTSVWRMEPEDVDDAICDGGGDKGIDALVVDDDLAEITVLQGKYREQPGRTQGDADLKALVGAAEYFVSPETVDALLASSPNQELRHLVLRQDVGSKIANGTHVVRLVFVTNGELDASGRDYVATRRSLEPPLDVWDRARLVEVAERTRRPDLRPETVILSAVAPPTEIELTDAERLALALVPARQLADLPGIADFTLFSRNVRLFAGRTRINNELRDTVRDIDEHRLFPAYHNGLTLLTNGLTVENEQLTLQRVGVVNGCQSLLTLYNNRDALTGELKLLVKVVEVSSDTDVADKITYRSNNQNAVTLRDQRSSDPAMRDLQKAVQDAFGSGFALRARAGENPGAHRVLDNAVAAQLIMACYLQEPWAAVRKVRLFDQDFRRVFNRTITPHKLYLLALLDSIISDVRLQLRDELRASFASVRFTLVHLVAQVLRQSQAGLELLETPERWLPGQENDVRPAVRVIADDVVESVNFHIREEERDRDDFDPKVVFKSRAGVERLENDVLRQSRRQAQRDSEYLFQVAPDQRRVP